MSRRRGAALLQVLVLAGVIIAAAMAVIRWQLQRHQLSAKSANRTKLEIDVEGAKNAVASCLNASGYPSGTCQPTAAQAACVPAGITASFSGTPPACTMNLTASR